MLGEVIISPIDVTCHSLVHLMDQRMGREWTASSLCRRTSQGGNRARFLALGPAPLTIGSHGYSTKQWIGSQRGPHATQASMVIDPLGDNISCATNESRCNQ